MPDFTVCAMFEVCILLASTITSPLRFNQGPSGHHLRSTRKRDRSILCIAQNSVIPFFPQKTPCCASYGFLYFAADTPPF